MRDNDSGDVAKNDKGASCESFYVPEPSAAFLEIPQSLEEPWYFYPDLLTV